MKMTCIAVDDEPLALDQIVDFINKIPYLELKASFKKGIDALIYIKENKTDLVFLDIHLDDISGIQILKSLKHKPFVILTTAYDQYALEGYELDVNDYLLKPISFERFVKAIEKVHDLMINTRIPAVKGSILNQLPEFIFIKADYKMRKIVLKDILFIEGYKDYMKIHLSLNRPVVSLMSFKKIESILPSQRFIRIHKSFLVSVDKIDSIGKNAITIGEHSIPIGETFKEQFFSFLDKKELLR
jgi:two-component system, LytTR family, response regulator